MPLLSNKTSRPKDTKGTLLRLLSYLSAFWIPMAAALILSLGANLLALAGPKLAGRAIDAVSLGKGKVDFATVAYYTKLMIYLGKKSSHSCLTCTRISGEYQMK